MTRFFNPVRIIITMKIDLYAKNMKLDEALEVFVEDRIGGLDKVIGNDKSVAHVEIGLPSKHHRSGKIYYAEVNLNLDGKLFRATCQHEDLRNAIVDVKNELQEQITKFKDKSAESKRQPQR